jgi:ABC-type bacteriocin/lantibiotic exporter with double-glycine peptidase domain
MKRGSPVAASPLLWFLILSLILSCAGLPQNRASKTARIIKNVPFYPQEAYQCGPASLAGVLNYWGLNISPAEIAAEIYSPKARGTLDVDMVFYAQRKGLKARQYQGNVEDVKRNIDSNQPLVVLVDDGFWVYEKAHFMVVVGYDEEGLIVNSGKERHQFISLSRFLRSWKRAKFWTLRITP